MLQKIIVIVLVWASLTCPRGASTEAVVAGVIPRIPSRSSTGVAVAVRVADAALVITGQVCARRADFAVCPEAEAALVALDDVLAKHGSDGVGRVDGVRSTRLREKGGKRQPAGGRHGTEGLGGVEFDVARAPRIALLNEGGGGAGHEKNGARAAHRVERGPEQRGSGSLIARDAGTEHHT